MYVGSSVRLYVLYWVLQGFFSLRSKNCSKLPLLFVLLAAKNIATNTSTFLGV